MSSLCSGGALIDSIKLRKKQLIQVIVFNTPHNTSCSFLPAYPALPSLVSSLTTFSTLRLIHIQADPTKQG